MVNEREVALQAVRQVEVISTIAAILNSGLVAMDVGCGKILLPISVVFVIASIGSEIYIRRKIK
jgi:predicted ATP-dependent Lon-type protease